MPKDLPFQDYESVKPVRVGGRIGSAKLRASIEQSEEFAGLPEDTERYDLLILVKRAGKSAGFTAKMILLLDYYMAFTRDVDWEQGGRPIVYQSLSKTALDLGVTERQIQRLEQALFEVGALTWNDSGNHRRYGQRDPKSGMILYAYGVDLSPLAYLKDELQDKLEQKQLYDQAWMETKRQISWYRRQTKACMAELIEQGADVQEFERLYDKNAMPIRTHMSLETLRTLFAAHKDLHMNLMQELEQSQLTQINTAKETKMIQKESPPDDSVVVHYNSSTHKQSDKSDTGSASLNCFRESSNGNSGGKEVNKEKKPRSKEPEPQTAQGEDGLILSTGLQHITLKQALNAASEEFRAHIPLEPRPMSWNDVIEAAYKRKSGLHISQKSWAEACVTLGRTGAAVCILLTDQATQRPDDPVRKPGAYFNAMIARAKSGELRLHKAIFGILKRGEDV